MSVGRPRKADPEVVLEAVLSAFWKKGYESTSMSDLTEATGLHKGSLYQTFGDKLALFKAALTQYMEQLFLLQKSVISEAKSPSLGLRQAFYVAMERSTTEEGVCRGCMAVNTLVETAPEETEVRELLSVGYAKWGSLIQETIGKAVAEKEVVLAQPVDLTTQLLMTFMCGLAAQSRQGMSLLEAKALLDQQFKLLGFKLA